MNFRLFSTALILLFIHSCTNDEPLDDHLTGSINKVLNRQSTGSSANDLLSDNSFTSMIIEIVYVEGLEPTQNTINNFVTFLNNRTYKPSGITVKKRVIPSPGQATYTIEDIANIEREERQEYNQGSKIAVWALFIDGKSDNDVGNEVVLGTAYWNTSFVIYEETVQALSNSPFEPERSVLETTVINHEFGHILGLTNLGSTMQTNHEDVDHPKHCDEKDCLMYWESESSVALTGMSTIPLLDAQCLADLKANGGK
ncbi:membrane metalloprotease [Tamlana fucoidanivorans]|uniref:Membrane metalloprotease n=1 Tax=Allotamlana fucoidanivorans TaxID=2583814 RepID=A0A5C4SPF5_9FLAO|nr:membrane metalloprotease [Tamlana fucoidanivorans]TNJ46144.1 membrane metalloprotease [Tamlana fucoidanivorans]